ncbi:MAG: hypothetical protein LBC35_03600 [Coriobacteriales bacterium]|jgi:hypothetical protein|nr:hypothetical protein [Coriobacteriales bacterium]
MDSKPSKPSTLWLMLGNVGRGVLVVLVFALFDSLNFIQSTNGFVISLAILTTLALFWLSFASYRYYESRIAQGFTAFNTSVEIAFGVFLYALSTFLSFFIYLSIEYSVNGWRI